MADAPDATPAAAANDDTPDDAPGAPTPAVGAPEAESAPEAEGAPDGGGGAPLQLVIPDRSRSAAEELLGKAAAVIVPSTPETPAEGEEHPTFEFVKVRADALPLPRTAARARASAAHECPCLCSLWPRRVPFWTTHPFSGVTAGTGERRTCAGPPAHPEPPKPLITSRVAGG